MVRSDPTIGELENWSATVLCDEVFSSYDTQVLLCFCLGKSPAYLLTHRNDVVDKETESWFRDLVDRRLTGVPVAYLTGYREFWSLPIMVDENVLIPRPDTELLVEHVLTRIPIHSRLRILELGTGSGAVALALATERPNSSILATDRSVSAIEVARKNQTVLNINNISWIVSDWFGAIGNQEFDIICSNPPYIAISDHHLIAGDLRSEPVSALASGEQGLDDLKLIVRQSAQYLISGGSLLVEHGYQQGEQVRQIFQAAGYLDIRTLKDLSANDRVTVGVKPL